MSYAASPSTTSVGPHDGATVFKITLERQKEQELRRVRGTFSFDEISTVIRHMWNSAPKRLSVEYVDEDGDRVRVSTELEWAEAIQQHAERGERALRLFVRRARKGTGTKAKDPVESGSDSDAEETATTVAATRAVSAAATMTSAVPPLEMSRVVTPPRAATPLADPEPCIDVDAMGSPEPTAASTATTEGTPEHENTIDLISRLFDCDAAKEMQDMFSRVDFTPIVTRKVDAIANEVLVDVDKAALRHLTVSRTNLWIGNGLYEKAESTLDAAMRVWPDDALFEYNAACSASLRGDLTKAVSLLRDAVEHGYRNAQQLKRDPDLENVRDHPEFGAILRVARGEPAVVPEEPAPTPAPVPVPTPAPVAPAPVPQGETDVDRLLTVFPHMTLEEANAVLKRCGNLTVAVNHCLANV